MYIKLHYILLTGLDDITTNHSKSVTNVNFQQRVKFSLPGTINV